MPPNLQIGRVGLDVDLNSPQDLSFDVDDDRRRVTIRGYLRAASLDETKALRSELLAQRGQLVPVTWAGDSSMAGVGVVDAVTVDVDWRDGALQGAGFFRFAVVMDWVGSTSEVEFQSLLSSVEAVEDHSTTPEWWHAPPVGSLAYSAGGATPVLIDRATEDGTIHVATDMPAGTHPTWSVNPANYYDGAVELWAGSRLRAGRDMPMLPAGWEINAKTLRIRPGVTADASNGAIEVAAWQGSDWGPWVSFSVWWAGTNRIPSWHYVSVLKNTPEAVVIRLVRDAAEAPFASTAKHELDINVRRGGRLVTMLYKFDGASAQHAVGFTDTTAAARPSSASYINATSLVSGDRWLVGAPAAFTEDAVEGQVQIDNASKSMPWWVGVAVGNASNGTGDGPADLAKQFVAQSGEIVRAVRR